MSVLLRQPHGFEGFGLLLEDAQCATICPSRTVQTHVTVEAIGRSAPRPAPCASRWTHDHVLARLDELVDSIRSRSRKSREVARTNRLTPVRPRRPRRRPMRPRGRSSTCSGSTGLAKRVQVPARCTPSIVRHARSPRSPATSPTPTAPRLRGPRHDLVEDSHVGDLAVAERRTTSSGPPTSTAAAAACAPRQPRPTTRLGRPASMKSVDLEADVVPALARVARAMTPSSPRGPR